VIKQHNDSAARGIWAVAWRSLVYLPMMLGMFVLLLVHVCGLFLLPFIVGTYLWFGLWRQGLIALAVWLLLCWSWRHFRLSEHFQSPPSTL